MSTPDRPTDALPPLFGWLPLSWALGALLVIGVGVIPLMTEGASRGDHAHAAVESALPATILQLAQPVTPAHTEAVRTFLTFAWTPFLHRASHLRIDAIPPTGALQVTLVMDNDPTCRGVLDYFVAHPDQAARAQLQINGKPATHADALALYTCFPTGRGHGPAIDQITLGPILAASR